MLDPRSVKRAGAVALVVATALASCSLNHHGNYAASKLGDTSHPARRGSPVAALQAACGGVGELTPDGARMMARRPYLQQVTATSAIVGFTAVAGDLRVDVTAPDGRAIASAKAEAEDTRTPLFGARRQVWARLADLLPDTVYCYTVASTTAALSQRIGFRTAPAADSTRTIRFLAFGDSGGGDEDQYELLEQMFDVPFELIVHTGDIAYDDGTLAQFEANVFDVYAGLFRHVPFFPSPGNHDYKTQGGQPYRDVFALPGDSGERWYSYDWGRVHFVSLDSQSDMAAQVEWLERDLAATELPWRIVYMHEPPYSSGDHGSSLAWREALAPLLEQHGVQLVLSGHDHHYERTRPQHGTTYVVTGGGGRGTRGTGASDFTAFSDEVIHFTYVEVGVDELTLHAIDATGQEFDSAVIRLQAR